MPTRSIGRHVNDKPTDSRKNTMAGIKCKSEVFLVKSWQMLFGINLFPQNYITCSTPELGKSVPFPKEWSLLGDVFLHPLYLPEI